MKGLGALLVLDATCTWLGIFSLDLPEHDSLQRNLGTLSFLHPFPSASLKHSLFSCFYVYAGAFFFKNFIYLFLAVLGLYWASLVAQLVKNPPAMQETRVRSLGWEDPLEKGKAPYSSILTWRIPSDPAHGLFSSCGQQGLLFVAMAALVAEHRL